MRSTLPKIHLSLRVTISIKEDEVQNANTKRSAIDKFSRNMVVEVRKTEDVKMTIMTKRFPRIPTNKIIEQRTKLVQAMNSGSSASVPTTSVVLFMILRRSFDDWDAFLSKRGLVSTLLLHAKWRPPHSLKYNDCVKTFKISLPFANKAKVHSAAGFSKPKVKKDTEGLFENKN